MSAHLSNQLAVIVQTVVTLLAAFTVAFWLGLVVWTFRDIYARSRDILALIFAPLLVLVLGPAGWLLYLLLRPHRTLAELYDQALEEDVLLRQVDTQPVCPNCKQPVEKDWQVCPYCHTPLRRPCPNCGRLIDISWDICPYCATDVEPALIVRETPPADHLPAAAPPVETVAAE